MGPPSAWNVDPSRWHFQHVPGRSNLVIGDINFYSWCSCTENWVFIARFDWRAKKFKVHQSLPFHSLVWVVTPLVRCPHLALQPCPVPPGSMDIRCILPPWCMPSEDATSLSHYVGTELLEGSFRILQGSAKQSWSTICIRLDWAWLGLIRLDSCRTSLQRSWKSSETKRWRRVGHVYCVGSFGSFGSFGGVADCLRFSRRTCTTAFGDTHLDMKRPAKHIENKAAKSHVA